MKALIAISLFLAFASTVQASSYYAYEMTCDAALAGSPAKGEPAVRTKLTMTFCGIDLAWMAIDENDEAVFGSSSEYQACEGQEKPGVSYKATRHDGSTYSGFIEAGEGAQPLSDGEDGSDYVMGNCDGDICEGDSAYFRLSRVAEQPFSDIQLVRQGSNGPLYYNFEKANCSSVDIFEKEVEAQQELAPTIPAEEIIILD